MNTNSYFEYFAEFFNENFEERPGRFEGIPALDEEALSDGVSLGDISVEEEHSKTVRCYFRVNKNDARQMKTGNTGLETPTVIQSEMMKVLEKYMENLGKYDYRSETLEGVHYDNHIFANEAIFRHEMLGVLDIFRRYILDNYNSRHSSRRRRASGMERARENEFVVNTIRCIERCIHRFKRFAKRLKDDLIVTAKQYEPNDAKCNIRNELQNVKVKREEMLLKFVVDLKEHCIELE